MDQQPNALPVLPCPSCTENLLAVGFYNYCNESVSLREDNHTDLIEDKLYIDHDESGHETTDHECEMNSYCGGCDTLLPWALYQLRGLDGQTIAQAEASIADLLDELDDAEPLPPADADAGEGARV